MIIISSLFYFLEFWKLFRFLTADSNWPNYHSSKFTMWRKNLAFGKISFRIVTFVCLLNYQMPINLEFKKFEFRLHIWAGNLNFVNRKKVVIKIERPLPTSKMIATETKLITARPQHLVEGFGQKQNFKISFLFIFFSIFL